ncbi:hypothetical protein OG828_02555 [Streptomyces sp. NBC_00457]|uniref:hypothetical protein n=1 Tax=Streptomyces sp. NBC_00457 TaxID=2975748 RepID=UPI002E22DB17
MCPSSRVTLVVHEPKWLGCAIALATLTEELKRSALARSSSHTTINAEYLKTSSGQQGEPFVLDGDRRLIAQLLSHHSHKRDIALFSSGKEEAADAVLWFPS